MPDATPGRDAPDPRAETLPVGVIVRRSPGVTRWQKWAWRAVGVIPGAGPGHWRELRRDGASIDFHAATAPLTLHRRETEAYLPALANTPPLIWAVFRVRPGEADARPELLLVTASAFEAQDYGDNGEDIVEPLEMPEALSGWVADFVKRHHVEEPFVKRKRRRHFEDLTQDGIGDARVRQAADVYRAPGSMKARRQ